MLQAGLFLSVVMIGILLWLVICGRLAWLRLLSLSLMTGLIVVAIILYAAYTGISMYLDVALAFALLGFVDIQFFSVFLRRRGGL